MPPCLLPPGLLTSCSPCSLVLLVPEAAKVDGHAGVACVAVPSLVPWVVPSAPAAACMAADWSTGANWKSPFVVGAAAAPPPLPDRALWLLLISDVPALLRTLPPSASSAAISPPPEPPEAGAEKSADRRSAIACASRVTSGSMRLPSLSLPSASSPPQGFVFPCCQKKGGGELHVL